MKDNGNWVPLSVEEGEDLVDETIYFEGGYRVVSCWRKNNEIACERYFNEDGQLHREDGPARYNYYYTTGTLSDVYYYKDGILHRIGGPAAQSWWSDGSLDKEEWYVDGKRHREGDEPALIRMSLKEDFAEFEGYFVNDRPHRTNGPAIIERCLYFDKASKQKMVSEQIKFYHHGLQQSGAVDDPYLTPS